MYADQRFTQCTLEMFELMSFDIIFRYLLHLGYKVRYVTVLLMWDILWTMQKMEDKIAKKHV
jgi:cysteinyl-tRNA synthetase